MKNLLFVDCAIFLSSNNTILYNALYNIHRNVTFVTPMTLFSSDIIVHWLPLCEIGGTIVHNTIY